MIQVSAALSILQAFEVSVPRQAEAFSLPEQIGQEVFAPLGFSRQPLSQFQMELAL
jgi:hypothetical protein